MARRRFLSQRPRGVASARPGGPPHTAVGRLPQGPQRARTAGRSSVGAQCQCCCGSWEKEITKRCTALTRRCRPRASSKIDRHRVKDHQWGRLRGFSPAALVVPRCLPRGQQQPSLLRLSQSGAAGPRHWSQNFGVDFRLTLPPLPPPSHERSGVADQVDSKAAPVSL